MINFPSFNEVTLQSNKNWTFLRFSQKSQHSTLLFIFVSNFFDFLSTFDITLLSLSCCNESTPNLWLQNKMWKIFMIVFSCFVSIFVSPYFTLIYLFLFSFSEFCVLGTEQERPKIEDKSSRFSQQESILWFFNLISIYKFYVRTIFIAPDSYTKASLSNSTENIRTWEKLSLESWDCLRNWNYLMFMMFTRKVN